MNNNGITKKGKKEIKQHSRRGNSILFFLTACVLFLVLWYKNIISKKIDNQAAARFSSTSKNDDHLACPSRNEPLLDCTSKMSIYKLFGTEKIKTKTHDRVCPSCFHQAIIPYYKSCVKHGFTSVTSCNYVIEELLSVPVNTKEIFVVGLMFDRLTGDIYDFNIIEIRKSIKQNMSYIISTNYQLKYDTMYFQTSCYLFQQIGVVQTDIRRFLHSNMVYLVNNLYQEEMKTLWQFKFPGAVFKMLRSGERWNGLKNKEFEDLELKEKNIILNFISILKNKYGISRIFVVWTKHVGIYLFIKENFINSIRCLKSEKRNSFHNRLESSNCKIFPRINQLWRNVCYSGYRKSILLKGIKRKVMLEHCGGYPVIWGIEYKHRIARDLIQYLSKALTIGGNMGEIRLMFDSGRCVSLENYIPNTVELLVYEEARMDCRVEILENLRNYYEIYSWDEKSKAIEGDFSHIVSYEDRLDRYYIENIITDSIQCDRRMSHYMRDHDLFLFRTAGRDSLERKNRFL